MQAREFLALADQLAAFQAITSGSLKKETEEARGALKALQEANDLISLSKSIKTEKEVFEKYKAEVEGVLKASTDELAKTESLLSEKEMVLIDLRAQLDKKEYDLKVSQKDAAAALEAIQKEADKAEARLAKVEKTIATQKAELTAREEALAAQEAAVKAKLEALKAIAG